MIDPLETTNKYSSIRINNKLITLNLYLINFVWQLLKSGLNVSNNDNQYNCLDNIKLILLINIVYCL